MAKYGITLNTTTGRLERNSITFVESTDIISLSGSQLGGIVPPSRGGTGISNLDSSLLTVSGAMSAAGRNVINTFSQIQIFEKNTFIPLINSSIQGIVWSGGGKQVAHIGAHDSYATSSTYWVLGVNRYYSSNSNLYSSMAWEYLGYPDRLGSSLLIWDNLLVFQTFPANSTTPTAAFSVSPDDFIINNNLIIGKSSGISGIGDLDIAGNQNVDGNSALQGITRVKLTSSTNGKGLRFWDGTDDYGSFQCLNAGSATSFFFSSNRQYDGSAWQQLNTRIGDSLILAGGMSYYIFATSSSVPVLLFSVSSTGAASHILSDATTVTAPNLITLKHNTSGTAGVGFGITKEIQLDSATVNNRTAATDILTWVTAIDASRKVRRVHTVYDTAARETFREEATGSAPAIGVLGATAVVRQTSGADLTNNVTSGGTNDTITNWTSLTVYATDAAAIRNAVYQLARKVKQLNDGLRNFGYFD